MSVVVGSVELSKYPFLLEARKYLADRFFTLDMFDKDPDLLPVIDTAFKRIETASMGDVFKDKDNVDIAVFSFIIATIMLKKANSPTLIRRFALAEARKAEKHLESDLLQMNTKIGDNIAEKILHDLFLLKVGRSYEDFTVPVEQYLHHSVQFHEPEWKLVNRRVGDGLVYLTRHEAVRLIRKQLDKFITNRTTQMVIEDLPKVFDPYIEKLREMGSHFEVQTTWTGKYPPCVKHAIEVLEKGENLGHSARFMLASYMFNVGKTPEEIAEMFKNAPDYNARVTLYQVKKISSGPDGKPYTCKSCVKLQGENLCFRTDECGTIVNPLQFGRIRKRDDGSS